MEKFLYDKINKDESGKNWWFRARKNIIIDIIKNFFKNNREISIMDVGSGTGFLIDDLLANGYKHIIGIDSSQESLRICKQKGLNVIYGELPQIDTSKKYDCITSLDVIEHVSEDVQSLKNIINCLNVKGKAIFTVPAYQFLRGYHDEIHHHKRRYTLKDFRTIIENVGGKIEYISYYNFFLFPIALLFKYINRKSGSLSTEVNHLINYIFYKTFDFERKFINNRIKFPFGVSIIAIVSKK